MTTSTAAHATYYTGRAASLIKAFRRQSGSFQAVLRRRYGDAAAGPLLAATEGHLRALLPRLPFIGGSRNPLTENLVASAWFLALFRALQAAGVPEAELGEVTYEIGQDMVSRRSRLAGRLTGLIANTWPVKALLRRITRASLQRRYPGDFVVEYVEGDGRAFDFGYDFHECAICKLYQAEGQAQWARHLCRIDYLTSQQSGLTLTRTGTIAQGAPRCDFRFKRAGR